MNLAGWTHRSRRLVWKHRRRLLIPRWGIKVPIHINALLSRRNGRQRGDDAKSDDSAADVSNVTPLGKKVG
jgi:hypothetical protein